MTSLRLFALGALTLSLAACATDTAEPPADPANGGAAIEAPPAEVPAGTYALDPAHSELGFRVRHLGISNVDGTFEDFDGTLTIPESGLEGLSATVNARIASIETGIEDRNAHLRSPDFFAADEFPDLTFQSTSVEPLGGNRFRLTGDLTIRGTTRRVTLEGTYLGASSMQGQQKIGFEATGEINRKDFGLVWDNRNEAGEIIVADTITLMISAEANLQAGDAAAPAADAPADSADTVPEESTADSTEV